MKREDLVRRIRSILAPYVPAGELERLPPDKTHLVALGVESADLINIIVEVEDDFEFEIEVARLQRLLTLADLVDAVEAMLEQR